MSQLLRFWNTLRVKVEGVAFIPRFENLGFSAPTKIKEGERLEYLNTQIVKLEAEWERLDSQGNQIEKQQKIQQQLAMIQREKEKWDKIYRAANPHGITA
jgi:hypothetical protein